MLLHMSFFIFDVFLSYLMLAVTGDDRNVALSQAGYTIVIPREHLISILDIYRHIVSNINKMKYRRVFTIVSQGHCQP